ncbi:MAG: signal peptide peptidase SppA [Candidatus Nanoarchaeia archaeon]
MNDGKTKFWYALMIIAILWLVSFALSNLLDFENRVVGNKIVIIPIKGVLTSDGDALSFIEKTTTSSRTIVNFIQQAETDSSVKGIILEINSPGGTVMGSKEIADAVKKTKKPTIAVIREVGASGGYWVASAADKVIADPLSITGSIGVTSSYLEFTGLMEKYGVTYEELSTGKYKESGSPFKELTPEERARIQKQLEKIQSYFIEEVRANRNLDQKTITEIKEAGIYLGEEAYQLNMVDLLGGMDTAINLTKEMANITEAKIVRYEEEKGLFDILGILSAESFYYMGRGIGAEITSKQRTQGIMEIRS